MLLTIDIGNTNILLGLFEGGDLEYSWRLSTDKRRTRDELGIYIYNLLQEAQIDTAGLKGAMVSSVVPPLNTKLSAALKKYFNIHPLFLTYRSKLGISLKVDEPANAGPDRIANCIGGYELYGGPLLIIDFGTATTFDLVSKKGEFMGGAIAPEMYMTAQNLIDKAALLPAVELVLPSSVIGKDTAQNLNAGFVLGFIDLVTGLIRRFRSESANDLRVISTGGKGELLTRQVDEIERYDPFLTLKGLKIAWGRNRGG